jgi:beta-glucosidase
MRLLAAVVVVFAVVVMASASPLIGKLDPVVEARIAALLKDMPLEEKIGQMTQSERLYTTPADVKKFFLGSVLSGGGSWPSTGNTPQDWADMVDAYQAAALAASPRKIPFIYGQDGVHGVNNVYGAVVFPHQVGLGATRDPELLRLVGRVLNRELRACGTPWTFAPCVANARDERWGRRYESFGEDPALIAALTAPLVEELQSGSASDDVRMVGCAKHFIGDGGALYGTGRNHFPIDRGDCRGDEEMLRRLHTSGYVEAIRAGVGTVMVSLSSFNGELMHHHRRLLTEYLKGELGFNGYIITDYNGVYDLPNSTDYLKVVSAINAGVDQFMVPSSYRTLIQLATTAAQKGDVPMSRIDDAVTRILRVKIAAGLFEHPFSNRSYISSFGSAEHRAVARRAVQESAVLLKNEKGILPLSRSARIFVAGAGANDIGLQCGGWTISWQGSAGKTTIGTTIVDGLRAAVGTGGSVTYKENGKGAAGDVAIVVVSELPYAEGEGDSTTLAIRSQDLKVLEEVRKSGIPMVVVMLSGRPLIISEHLPNWTAFVQAFLPGTEAGTGLADLLFGSAKFTGRLPWSWPRSVSQEPINVGDVPYDPLFPYGAGL